MKNLLFKIIHFFIKDPDKSCLDPQHWGYHVTNLVT